MEEQFLQDWYRTRRIVSPGQEQKNSFSRIGIELDEQCLQDRNITRKIVSPGQEQKNSFSRIGIELEEQFLQSRTEIEEYFLHGIGIELQINIFSRIGIIELDEQFLQDRNRNRRIVSPGLEQNQKNSFSSKGRELEKQFFQDRIELEKNWNKDQNFVSLEKEKEKNCSQEFVYPKTD